MSNGWGEVVEKLRRSTVQVKAGRRPSGSGVIWGAEGKIVTNAHVVEGADSLEVELWDGRTVPGKLTKRDRRGDLAIVQIRAAGLPAIVPGNAGALRVGELVVAVGNPLGFTGAASTGVVHRSNLNGGWVVSQLRLAPGNSGGPLANALGEVVGINTMVAGTLAFAIPTERVKEFQQAETKRRYGLGLVARPLALSDGLGLLVLEVVTGTPADNVSLLKGDVLVGAGEKRFRGAQDLETAIQECGRGMLTLQFRRGATDNIRQVAVRLSSLRSMAA